MNYSTSTIMKFIELFPSKVCKYSDWKEKEYGCLPKGVIVKDISASNVDKLPEFVKEFISNNRKVKKVIYYDESKVRTTKKSQRKRINKKAEFIGLTPMQIDFLVNMVNDENWVGIDDTTLKMTEYVNHLETTGVMNCMQAGMMLTVLRNKGFVESYREYAEEYGEKVVCFTLNKPAKDIFEKLLDYVINNDRIKLFDETMTAKDLI